MGEKEEITEFIAEGGAGVIGKATRSVRIVGERRNDKGCLSGKPWSEEPFLHPNVVGLFARHFGKVLIAVPLPMESPSSHSTFHDMNETFPFPRVVTVVVNAEKISEFVENRFLSVPQPESEDLEVRPVRFTAHDTSSVRVKEMFPVLSRGIDSLVRH